MEAVLASQVRSEILLLAAGWNFIVTAPSVTAPAQGIVPDAGAAARSCRRTEFPSHSVRILKGRRADEVVVGIPAPPFQLLQQAVLHFAVGGLRGEVLQLIGILPCCLSSSTQVVQSGLRRTWR